MKKHQKNKSVLIPGLAVLTAMILIMAGCVSRRPDLVLGKPVGPRENRAGEPAENGKLVVYGLIEPSTFVEEVFFYHYSEYTIYDSRGQILKEVPSPQDDLFPVAATVELPPGAYKIRAHSRNYGIVSVPVVIRGGRTTPVYLDGRVHSEMSAISSTREVTLPKGEVVGWKSGS